jgi:uncharacterized protein
MVDGLFEWDPVKALSNLKKHKVSFEMARRVFTDANAIEEVDALVNYSEERVIRTGMAAGLLLTVVYTERDDCIRIISARKATSHEQDDYHRENPS